MDRISKDEKEKNLVSVIIPVFNVFPFLEEALDSAINQTYHNLEIIVVDDGSTDGSNILCDEYAKKDNRIRIIHQENRGIGAARNAGLDIMKGKYVAFLDSDDAYHPDYINNMIEIMTNEKVDIVICGYIKPQTTQRMTINEAEEVYPSLTQGKYNKKTILCALVESTLGHGVWNMLYKKELWEELRFPEGVVYEDSRTTYRVINRAVSVYVLKEPLYMYRKHMNSISNDASLKNTDDLINALSVFESFVKENVPDIFTQEHLKSLSQSNLKRIIKAYTRFSGGNNKNKEFSNKLRKQIYEYKEDVKQFSIRIKTAYFVARYCPCLLRAAYPFCSKLH